MDLLDITKKLEEIGLNEKQLNKLNLFITELNDKKSFLKEISYTRNHFNSKMLGDSDWLNIPVDKRVEIENILIMYDQMYELIIKL